MEKQIKQLRELKKFVKKSKEMRLAAESWDAEFKILISTILSARTRDEVTIPIAEKLFKKFPNPKKLGQAKISEIEEIIKPINFYKNKSKNIIECSKQITTEYRGKIPHEINELIILRGVGRKTANVFLSQIGRDAIGVDTHVSYCSQKLGWTENKNPKKIEEDLKKLFPKKYWSQINESLVRFGKSYKKKEKDEILESIKKPKMRNQKKN